MERVGVSLDAVSLEDQAVWVDSGNENSWLWRKSSTTRFSKDNNASSTGQGQALLGDDCPSCSLAAPRCPPAAGACSYLPYLSLSAQPASAGRERWAPCCISSLPSVCALYSLAGPQSPPGTLQTTSVFDYICLEHLFMSICGVIKESPRPVLLCHAEMKRCQRVSAAAPSVTQQPEQTVCEQSPARWGQRETGRSKWVAGFYPPMPAHGPTASSTHWCFFCKICLCLCVSRRHTVVINVSSFLANPCCPRSE